MTPCAFPNLDNDCRLALEPVVAVATTAVATETVSSSSTVVGTVIVITAVYGRFGKLSHDDDCLLAAVLL